MKKISSLILISLAASMASFAAATTHVSAAPKAAFAAGSPTFSSLSGKMNIDLNDNSEADIRSYYASLNSLAAGERTGTNLLKNLKPILQDFTYYNYDAVWKIYEITDREWELSPASETTYGSYDASTGIITNYEFGSSASSPKNDPYVHTLYRNRDENGVTVESGRIKEWGSHQQNGGTNREHVWCQSRGFKAPSGAEGPAGTDVHHLISGDGFVNGKPHNNNPYGYVNPADIKLEGTDGGKYPFSAGNIAGSPLHKHAEDQSAVVFEPQDSDKGDIARACFYMVACYNNLSGTDTITEYNPNLTLVDYATSSGEREASSATHAVGMGILSDLLEWHELDPVDEYEIHRNNLIYNNFQHNRNPFIDFPEWVDYIWGDKAGTTSANPSSDAIGVPTGTPIVVSAKSLSLGLNEEKTIKATSSDGSTLSWSISDESVAKLSKTQSNSGETVTVTGLKNGSATITVSATIEGEVKSASISLKVSGTKPFSFSDIPVYVWIGIGVVVLIIVILLIVSPKFRKKAGKTVVKTLSAPAKTSSSKSSSKSKSSSGSSSSKKKTSSSKKK